MGDDPWTAQPDADGIVHITLKWDERAPVAIMKMMLLRALVNPRYKPKPKQIWITYPAKGYEGEPHVSNHSWTTESKHDFAMNFFGELFMLRGSPYPRTVLAKVTMPLDPPRERIRNTYERFHQICAEADISGPQVLKYYAAMRYYATGKLSDAGVRRRQQAGNKSRRAVTAEMKEEYMREIQELQKTDPNMLRFLENASKHAEEEYLAQRRREREGGQSEG